MGNWRGQAERHAMRGVHAVRETMGQRWHREAEAHLVRDGISLFMAVMVGWAVFVTVGMTACEVSKNQERDVTRVMEVSMQAQDLQEEAVDDIQDILDEYVEEESEPLDEYDVYMEDYEDSYYVDTTWEEYQEDYWSPAYEVPSDGLNSFTGVNYHDGRTETYYSSNVLYHYRTPEWTLDEEGFWRTEEGYYVVAASDMEQGTTFEGSKGTCIVLDSGCNAGVTDYYVAW